MLKSFLPNFINKRLFGDRLRYGLKIKKSDKDWIKWQKNYELFHFKTQKKGIGKFVNDQGYKIIKEINLNNKVILEVGPGFISHKKYWEGKPKKFILCDINKNALNFSKKKIGNITKSLHLKRSDKLPIKKNSIDIILSFYSLEHLYNLDKNLMIYRKILKKNGIIVGALPCEGGFLYGVGRFFTSRRFIHKKKLFNYDKIICWEHPNFINEIFFKIKKNKFKIVKIVYFPFNFFRLYDLNFNVSFILRK